MLNRTYNSKLDRLYPNYLPIDIECSRLEFFDSFMNYEDGINKDFSIFVVKVYITITERHVR